MAVDAGGPHACVAQFGLFDGGEDDLLGGMGQRSGLLTFLGVGLRPAPFILQAHS